MTPLEFSRRLAATGIRSDGRTADACRRVLVHGRTAYSVAIQLEINTSVISRALKRLRNVAPVDVCPACGQAIGGDHG